MMSWPPAFIDRIKAQLGDEAGAFFAAMDAPYAAALRLNPRREGAEAAAAAFVAAPVPWCPSGRYVREGMRPGLSPLHDAGAYYIQEASAMAPAVLLNARPGERVLDLCAAPGGKAGVLADGLGGEGLLVANEPDAARARLLSSTIERLGVINACVTRALPQALSARFEGAFDAILVDAPCSGEGMFRRDEQARAQWDPASPAGCAARQAVILDEAARMLRPGGRMVYSTCTFSVEENEGAVRAFLGRHPDFRFEDFTLTGVGASAEGCVRLWPHKVRGDGQFMALLLRDDGADAAKPRPRRPFHPDKAAREALGRFLELAPGLERLVGDREPALRGDILEIAPEAGFEAPAGVPIMRAGLTLGRVGKGYVEPDHALAMALSPGDAARAHDCGDEEAFTFLRGETLADEGRGWTLVTYRGMPLGWGKASGGALKNHLPKGLRRSGQRGPAPFEG